MAQSESAKTQERLSENDVQAIDHLREVYARLRKEISRVIVGQHEVVERLAICLFGSRSCLAHGRARAGEDTYWSASWPRPCR